MKTVELKDETGPFNVMTFEGNEALRIVLFAVGGGGDPARHLPLLRSFAELGCTVVAPHFDRLLSPCPTEPELLLRARRLRLSLDSVAGPNAIAAGVGHSIGATMLLALAGGKPWMRSGVPLSIAPDPRIDRLALLAPATDFYRAPEALDGVGLPILAWAGAEDAITPVPHCQVLRDEIGDRAPVDLRVTEGADHFSFMDQPPPRSTELLPHRGAFLAELASELCKFVIRR